MMDGLPWVIFQHNLVGQVFQWESQCYSVIISFDQVTSNPYCGL